VKNLKCIIETRMGSKRLPGKSMKFIHEKYRLIDFVIQNALNSKYLNKKNIFILTSSKKNNLSLVKYLARYKIKIICGSELNVISRYKKFDDGKNYSILRLTGDNPLIDPLIIDKFIKKFFSIKIDYLTTRGMCHSKNWNVKSDYPKGISLEIFSSRKLFFDRKKFTISNYEFPTWFFFNKKSNARVKKFASFGNIKKYLGNRSFTVDTIKDLNNIKKFIKKNNCIPGRNNFINFCNTH